MRVRVYDVRFRNFGWWSILLVVFSVSCATLNQENSQALREHVSLIDCRLDASTEKVTSVRRTSPRIRVHFLKF